MNIAVFCSDAADTYQLAVITALSKAAGAQGHRLVNVVTNVLPEDPAHDIIENQLLGLPSTGIVDGSIVLTDAVVHRAPSDVIRRFLGPLDHHHWVSIGRLGGHLAMVAIENSRSFRQMLDHLRFHHDYRDFLFLLGPETSADGRERAQAISSFLAEQGQGVEAHTLVCDFRGDLAHERVLAYLKTRRDRPPRAIVACNDGMALGALAALSEAGLKCPDDCAVTGFDDVEVAALEFPSLTTIRQPLAMLATHVLAQLEAQVAGRSYPVRSETVVPTQPLYRESCGCHQEGLTTDDYRRQLSRVQSLRTQEAALLHQGSSFSLGINASLDLETLVDSLDAFCLGLSAGTLTLALVPPADQQGSDWTFPMHRVYHFDGTSGVRTPDSVSLPSLLLPLDPRPAELLPLMFLLHNRGRRLGVLACAFPPSWTGFFKLMAANLSMGLSRIELLAQIQSHSDELEAAVLQRTSDLTDAIGALRLENERRRTLERDLEREQEALQTILDTQPLPLAILSREDGGIRYFNRPFAQLAGFDPSQPPVAHLSGVYGPILGSVEGWAGPYRELRLPGVSGGVLQVMAQKSELNLRGEACFIVGMMDLTRQKQLEQDLLTISERERERFGQELHDDVCQQLAALALYTALLGRTIEGRLGERLVEVDDLLTLTDGILEHVRSLSRGLFPIEVGTLALDQVFRQFLVRIESQTKVAFRLHSNLKEEPTGLVPVDELHLFRMLQEAVQNTLRHAQATLIEVRLKKTKGQLVFDYQDNGKGLGPGVKEGVGFRSLRYRASQLGASLIVKPGTLGGVSLSLSVYVREPTIKA